MKEAQDILKLAKKVLSVSWGNNMLIDPSGKVIDIGSEYHDEWFRRNWSKYFSDVEYNEDTLEEVPWDGGWIRIRYYKNLRSLSIAGEKRRVKRRGDKLMDIVLWAMEKSSGLSIEIGDHSGISRYKMPDDMGELIRAL